VGYRFDGDKREIIAYDPFGRWLGVKGASNYDQNLPTPESSKGQWVYYDFYKVWGQNSGWQVGYFITMNPKIVPGQSRSTSLSQTQLIDPDMVNDEAPNIGTYDGIEVTFDHTVFLPLVTR
jgi:hypothetical protein